MSEPRNPLWAAYVKAVTGDATAQAIADRITERVGRGVSQPTVNRWLNGRYSGELKAGNVAAFATAYDRPVLQAFLAAGMLKVADVRGALDDEEMSFVTKLDSVELKNSKPRATRVTRKRQGPPPRA